MEGRNKDYWVIKSQSKKKYNILDKYLRACNVFSAKYKNFVYIDSHGGSGKVLNNKSEYEDGSPLRARKVNLSFPCHIFELNKERAKILIDSLKGLPKINCVCNDCNVEIPKILPNIEKWKFVFCFIDPDGLIEDTTKKHQLWWKTIECIATQKFRTEILLNFPLEALVRLISYCSGHSDSRAEEYAKSVTTFFGTDEWKGIGYNKRKLLELYMGRLKKYYDFAGAILIRSEKRAPLYYLIYASKHKIGAKIMRDITKVERFGKGQKFLGNFENAYPLNNFIFEDK